MNNHYDVLIAGGGMVGGTLACALGGSGLKIGVIEPQAVAATAKDSGLRVSAITLASQTVFENVGAWAGMRARRATAMDGGSAEREAVPTGTNAEAGFLPAPVEAMRIWEDNSILNFDSADIGEPCLAWIIENSVIVAALAARLRQFDNIQVLSPARVATAQFGEQRVSVRLEDGRELQTTLLVGADGADSRVRRAAGIDWTRHDLGQSAIVAVVQTERAHARTAWQHFLTTGPLAFLPLADPQQVSIVWSADTARAAELMQLDDAAFNAELQVAFGDHLGNVQLASERATIPLALGFARDYTAQRVALIGDAAHTVHPLAGQGVNLGILDAATLAEVLLAAAGQKRDLGAHTVLRRYERARKGADVGMQAVTGGFRYLFGSRLPGLRALRDAGLRFTEQLPPIKNYFMRRASGLAGELPRLAQRGQR
jgi:2-octaprenylphenol hydroxylase